MLTSTLELGEIKIDVLKKNIRSMHLRVYPPLPDSRDVVRARISAPKRMSQEMIQRFARNNLAWIRQQHERLRGQVLEAPQQYVDGEVLHLWGQRLSLRILERESVPMVQVDGESLRLRVRPGADRKRKQAVLEAWYRKQTRAATLPLIAKWEPLMKVKVSRLYVQKMRARWGTCNCSQESIRLNSELARRPPQCLEYVVVHELVHLLEPSHNRRFYRLMDRFMPDWRVHEALLEGRNKCPAQPEGIAEQAAASPAPAMITPAPLAGETQIQLL